MLAPSISALARDKIALTLVRLGRRGHVSRARRVGVDVDLPVLAVLVLDRLDQRLRVLVANQLVNDVRPVLRAS